MDDDARSIEEQPGWIATASHPWGTAVDEPEAGAAARWALACAIVGMVCLGFVLGPLALSLGKTAKMEIAGDPERVGDDVASAAILMGKLGLVIHLGMLLAGLGFAFFALPRESLACP